MLIQGMSVNIVTYLEEGEGERKGEGEWDREGEKVVENWKYLCMEGEVKQIFVEKNVG